MGVETVETTDERVPTPRPEGDVHPPPPEPPADPGGGEDQAATAEPGKESTGGFTPADRMGQPTRAAPAALVIGVPVALLFVAAVVAVWVLASPVAAVLVALLLAAVAAGVVLLVWRLRRRRRGRNGSGKRAGNSRLGRLWSLGRPGKSGGRRAGGHGRSGGRTTGGLGRLFSGKSRPSKSTSRRSGGTGRFGGGLGRLFSSKGRTGKTPGRRPGGPGRSGKRTGLGRLWSLGLGKNGRRAGGRLLGGKSQVGKASRKNKKRKAGSRLGRLRSLGWGRRAGRRPNSKSRKPSSKTSSTTSRMWQRLRERATRKTRPPRAEQSRWDGDREHVIEVNPDDITKPAAPDSGPPPSPSRPRPAIGTSSPTSGPAAGTTNQHTNSGGDRMSATTLDSDAMALAAEYLSQVRETGDNQEMARQLNDVAETARRDALADEEAAEETRRLARSVEELGDADQAHQLYKQADELEQRAALRRGAAAAAEEQAGLFAARAA